MKKIVNFCKKVKIMNRNKTKQIKILNMSNTDLRIHCIVLYMQIYAALFISSKWCCDWHLIPSLHYEFDFCLIFNLFSNLRCNEFNLDLWVMIGPFQTDADAILNRLTHFKGLKKKHIKG